MIVQSEDSNGSYRSWSQLEVVPTSQLKRTASSTTSRTVQRTFKATKPEKPRTYLMIDSCVIGGPLNDEIQTLFSHYLFSSNDTDNEQFDFCLVRSLGVPVFRWTKYDIKTTFQDGGVLEYESIPVYEPFVLVVMDNDTFLDLVSASVDGVSFAQLGTYMLQLFGAGPDDSDNPDAEVATSNIVAVVDLEKNILKAQRKLNKVSSSAQRSVADLVDSAASFLLYEHNIELFRCKKAGEFAEYLHTLTRLIHHRVQAEVVTEIDCVSKAQREKMPEGLSLKEQEAFDLRQTWSSMLQMLPLMSRDKALALLASRPDCSCPRALFDLYNNLNSSSSGSSSSALSTSANNASTSTATATSAATATGATAAPAAPPPLIAQHKMLLLQNSFGTGKNGAVKNQAKLSKLVYNMITATEPEGLINKFK